MAWSSRLTLVGARRRILLSMPHEALGWPSRKPAANGFASESKNWPEEKWAELVQRLLKATDFNLLLVGGEAEGERLKRLSRSAGNSMSPSRLRLAQYLPLVELARLMENCQIFVGHDSGISHLAAALGLSGLVLWADTSEKIWRLLSSSHT